MGRVIQNLFIICSLTVVHNVISHVPNNDSCSVLCYGQRDEISGDQVCVSITKSACVSNNEVIVGSGGGSGGDTVRLSAVGLTPTTTNTQNGASDEVHEASLLLQWPVNYSNKSVAGFRLSVGSTGDNNPDNRTDHCTVYDLPDLRANNVSDGSNAFIRDSCTPVQADTVYNISVSELLSNTSLTYLIQVPSNLTMALNPISPTDWVPVVGVALELTPNERSANILGIMEKPNQILRNPYFSLTLNSIGGSKDYEMYTMNATTVTSVVQNDLTSYYYNVNLFDTECQDSLCQNISTPLVYMNAFLTTISTTLSTDTSPKVTPTIPTTPRPHVTGQAVTADTTRDLALSSEGTEGTSMSPPAPDDPNAQGKYLIIGLVVGIMFVAALIILGIVLHRSKRKKNEGAWPNQRLQENMELSVKASPTVLVLYSCDCTSHEQVVVEFALYLKHVFYCNVSMDLWEQSDITARGAVSWLLDKLETCEYVIIVCSAGARLKCVRGRAALAPKEDRVVPDIFPTALDCVAEKMWLLRNEEKQLDNFIVVCFDYAGENDIPPKLDLVKRYYLPADFAKLFCHIYMLNFSDSMIGSKDFEGRTGDTLHLTDTGRQLLRAVAQAKEFIANNPNWLLEELEREATPEVPAPVATEPVEVLVTPQKGKSSFLHQVVPPPSFYERNSDSMQQGPFYRGESPSKTSQNELKVLSDGPLRPRNTSTPSLVSEEDALLEQRSRYMHLDMKRKSLNIPPKRSSSSPKKRSPMSPQGSFHDGWTSVVRGSKKLMRQLKSKHDMRYRNLSDSHRYSSDPRMFDEKIMENGDVNYPPDGSQIPVIEGGQPDHNAPNDPMNPTANSQDNISTDSDSLSDEERLQKDVDFIHNFDINTYSGIIGDHGYPHIGGNGHNEAFSGESDGGNAFTNPMCLLSPLSGRVVMNGSAVHTQSRPEDVYVTLGNPQHGPSSSSNMGSSVPENSITLA